MHKKRTPAVLDNPKYREDPVIDVDYSREVRCTHCNRMFCYGVVKAEIKCGNCKKKFKYESR